MDKQTVIYPHKGVLLRNKKEWNIDISNSITRKSKSDSQIPSSSWNSIRGDIFSGMDKMHGP